MQVFKGSSLSLELSILNGGTLADPDDLACKTIAPSGTEVTYTFDGGVDGAIVKTSTGVYEFNSAKTDENGYWEVDIDASFNLAGSRVKAVRQKVQINALETQGTVS